MHRQNRRHARPRVLRPAPFLRLTATRLKFTGSMSASTGVAPVRRIALTEAKKLNGVVTTAAPGPIASRGQRQPQRVRTRRAPQRVSHAQLLRRSPLEPRHVLAENELLRLQHPPQRLQQLAAQRLVLAFQVQHRYRRPRGLATPGRIRSRRQRTGFKVSFLHTLMLSAVESTVSHTVKVRFEPPAARRSDSSSASHPVHCK